MLRAILSVIVGYIVMFLWVVVTLAAAWFALGSEFAHNEGTLEASIGWSVLMMGMGAIGAVLGGLVTASIGRASAPVKVLAGIVFVLGLATAVYNMRRTREEPAVPPEELTMAEAADLTKAPAWYDFGIPFVGCVGVLVGGRVRRGRASSTPTGEVGPV